MADGGFKLFDMIALRKTGSLNWIASQTSPLFFTAQAKKTLSEIAQKAVWASYIITLIKDANKFYQPSKSLAKLIEQLRIPSEKYHLTEDIKDEVKGMFSKGVLIRPQFIVQNRIKEGSSFEEFFFNPNYTVTQPIFQSLTNFRRNQFIYGEYGISKTVSFALYQHLSSYIHIFVFQSEGNKKLTEELKNLTKEGLIKLYPKCWYWSIEHNDFPEPKDMMKQIIDQAIQLPQQKKNMLVSAQSEGQLSKILLKIYRNVRIQRIIIIDHIHSAASTIRSWNIQSDVWDKEIKKLTKSKSKAQLNYEIQAKILPAGKENQKLLQNYTSEVQRINQLLKLQYRMKYQLNPDQSKKFEQAIKIIRQIQRFSQFGALHIFASSVNLEKEILFNRPQEDSSKLGLYLNKNHRTVHERQINFSKAIKQPIGKADFIDYFVFEMRRRIAFQTKVPKEAFDKWESQFRAKAANITFKSYYRIIFIRQYLFNKVTLVLDNSSLSILKKHIVSKTKLLKLCDFELSRDKNIEMLTFYDIGLKEDKQMDLIEHFEVYCREQSIKKMQAFLLTQRQNKLTFLQTLYCLAEITKKFNYSTLQFSTQEYNKILNCNLQQLFLDNIHNKELLPIEYNNKIITFHWTPEEFMQLAERFVKAKLLQFYDVYLNGYYALYFQRNKAGLGSIFQFAIMQLLNPSVSVQFYLKDEKGGLTPQNFNILNKKFFISFYKPADPNPNPKHLQTPYSIIDNFSYILKIAAQNQGKSIAGEPHIRKIKSLQFDDLSPTIDFAIVRCVQKKFEIFTFDVATSKKQKNIEEKMTAAISLFADLTKDSSFEKEKYIIQHVILCKQDLCLPKKSTPNFSITCSPYESLDASYAPQEHLHKYLYFHAFRKAVVDKNFDLEDPTLINERLAFIPSEK